MRALHDGTIFKHFKCMAESLFSLFFITDYSYIATHNAIGHAWLHSSSCVTLLLRVRPASPFVRPARSKSDVLLILLQLSGNVSLIPGPSFALA